MSHFATFKSSGVYGRDVEVAVARVTHFWQTEINGDWCVEIQLDTGKIVTVRGFVSDVMKKLEAAAEGGKPCET